MTGPTIDPPTPQEIEALLDVEHQLDVANDYRTARAQTLRTRATGAVPRPAPEPDSVPVTRPSVSPPPS